MKKNKMMRLASVLLILTLFTTCFISGTFAKYTTDQSSTDTARVAKWGVEVTAASGSAFSATYEKYNTDASVTLEGNSVDSANDDALVAPGTSGAVASVTLAGTPEVAVSVNYAAELKLDNWKVGDSEYFPIVITVDAVSYQMAENGTTSTDTTKYFTKIEDLVSAVQNAIAGYSGNYEAKQDLSKQNTPSVSWSWPFAAADSSAYQTDAKDTELGNADPAPTIELKITTTVTQID